MAGCGESRPSRREEKVLCVGNCCADFVNVAREYPAEDTDQRGLECYWQRGGNASNSCTVFSILSVPCEYMGVLGSQGIEASWIKDDFEKCGVDISHCVIKPVHSPISSIIVSQATGSRTILFYQRDRPELRYDEFHEKFHGDFSQYSWVHFELNNAMEDISRMIDDVITYNNRNCGPECLESHRSKTIISVEAERRELKNPESVMCKADIVFISKDYAKLKGYSCPTAAIDGLYSLCKNGALLICAWGETGAAARCYDSRLLVPALTDITVIDTLGAGDTFMAGVITSLRKQGWAATADDDDATRNAIMKTALEFGCYLAGTKCTMHGYQGLKQFVSGVS